MGINEWFHRNHPDVPAVDYPETAQDGGHPVVPPNADHKYFDQSYPPTMGPVGVLPSTEHPDAHWLEATKQGKFIPYVGEEPHGVVIDVDPSKIPVHDVDLIAARGKFAHLSGDPHQTPVPVVIIRAPSFFGIEDKISTNLWVLGANSPIQVVSRRPERTRVQLHVSTSGPVIIGATYEQVASGVGFVVDLGATISINTNQPLFASTAVANSVVSVMEEYTIVEGQTRF